MDRIGWRFDANGTPDRCAGERTVIVFLPLLLGPFAAWHSLEPCVTHTPAAIVMECQSNGYYGPRMALDRGVRISADVRVQPADDGRFWATIALNADIPADDRYTSAGIQQGIAPYWGDTQPWAVQLSTPADTCCERLKPIDVGEWHHIEVAYHDGRATLTVDGTQRTVAIDLGASAHPELLCVAVDPGETKPGSVAGCEWRNLAIEQ
jgi:hypothetical protein